MSKKNTFWNYDNKWVRFADTILTFLIPLLIFFGIEAIPVVSVNRHPVKVKAVIVDKCHRYTRVGGDMMDYYYEYKYNDISYHGIYSVLAHNVCGEIGDTIVIRLNENRPSQSIFNCNDFPNRTLKGKEYREYLKNQPRCYD
ncbi:MAG: hypothetical protein PUC14_05840 [Bacteroidales bacterium]|nr:hypothetical protein [Bacteroidales bacterium]